MTTTIRDQAAVRCWKRYPEYRPITHRWLTSAPTTWAVKKVSWLFHATGSGTTPNTGDQSYFGGDIPWVNTGDLNDGWLDDIQKSVTETAIIDHSALKVYPAGTLLIALYGATIGKLGIVSRPAVTNQACFAMARPKGVDVRYVLYWFLGNRERIVAMSYGGGQPDVSGELIRNLRINVPPLSEQCCIAAFLDRETATIDALVAQKERLIALLEEKRRAVISHAVTRGLDPAAPLKDSGSPFWGPIPDHWTMTKLRYLVPDERQVMYGIVLPGPHVDDGIPIVKGGNCEEGRLRLEFMSRTSKEIEAGYARSRLQEGDIVYAIRGSIGAAQIVPAELSGANLTQDAARIARHPGVNVRWLLYAVRSMPFFAKLEAGALGATIQGINIRDLKRADLPCPGMGEQEQIARFLDRQCCQTDSLIQRVADGIAHLHEYRAALISAAVTGQIDVRGEV
ncbi:MAG TPA: restriction endonuclease subunit S [Pirellulales bacterium]|nr:restriction endonuclease subunit S [Pirellulales bacterium]